MAKVATLNREQKRHLLLTMLESRHGDLREESLNRQGKGHFHVSGRGHEAMATVGAMLHDGDFLVPYYRDRGMVMGRGLTTRHLALEYFAKRDSASRGRMMPAHYCARELNIVSVPTPTGAQLVPACGIAWGLQMDQKDGVVVTCIGDASTRQGDFYEAISFAQEKKLPLLMIVEDNAYGISTPTRGTNPLALRVVNPAQWQVVDGTDPMAVHQAARQALDSIRAGEGPVFLWVKLERLSSHTSSDDHTLYRSKEDIASLEAADPIRSLKAQMIKDGDLTEKEFDKFDADLKEKVRKDYAAAEKADNPRADELMLESIGPAPELDTELFPAGKYRMGDLVNRTLRAGLDADPGRMIFGEDVEDPKGGVFRLTQKLSTDFPKQVFNSPLAESTIIGIAGGLALYGRRPVFEIQFIDFIYPGFNQLISNLANLRWRSNGEWKVPAVFYAPYGAYLPGGSLWHSQANESVFAHFPGINIIIPSTPEDCAGLLWTAMHAEDITLFLLPKHMLWAEREVTEPVAAIPFGVARCLVEGSDLTLVAWGNTVEKSTEALAELKADGRVELIDLRSIAPWDKAALEASVRKTGRLVIVQEDTETCSVGQMIITHLMGQPDIWAALKAPPVLVSKGHVMIGYNPIYEYAALPDAPRILDALRRTLAIDVARGETGEQLAALAAPVASTPVAAAVEDDHSPKNTVVAGTNDIIVRVPIMGEGLRSARVVVLNKKPGDPVRPDEVLCELETDKAVYPVESSFTGTFKAWQIKIDDTVLIGQDIALVTGDAASVAALATETPAPKKAAPDSAAAPAAAAKSAAPAATVTSSPSPLMQGNVRPPALSPAITRRLDTVVSANLLMDCKWDPIRQAREQSKAQHGKAAASPSAMMAWCVTRTMELHAGFRRVVNKDGIIHELTDFELGVAVALDGDRLGTAAIATANKLGWADFVTGYNRAIEETRGGKMVEVQAPLNISSLGAFGVENATPIVVPPAMSTLFIGAAHEKMVKDGGVVYPMEVVTLSLTFDHRVVNGAGAAAFMMELKRQFETFTLPGLKIVSQLRVLSPRRSPSTGRAAGAKSTCPEVRFHLSGWPRSGEKTGRGSSRAYRGSVPVGPPGTNMTEHLPTTGIDKGPAKLLKVLVIEDDVRWCTWVESNLESAGHHVHTAADGIAGLEMIAQVKPDVILCDIEMPRLNGFGVLEALRQQPGISDIPLIFLTSRNARVDQRKGMALGADDYLTKPFSREELLSAIAGALSRRETLAERLRHYTEEHRRELAAPWAHELLTPINGILGIASMIEAEPGAISPAELRELARSIHSSARRQQELARKLVQHFQLEQMKEFNWRDPAAVVEAGAGIEDEVIGVAERMGRSTDMQVDCVRAAVSVNAQWLRALAAELAENACKFSPKGSPVTVTARIVDGLYRIEVTDLGPGMTPEERSAIGAFRQFDRAKHEQQGLGLGLSLVRNVARLHRGSFGLEPGPGGQGLRAVVELPLAE